MIYFILKLATVDAVSSWRSVSFNIQVAKRSSKLLLNLPIRQVVPPTQQIRNHPRGLAALWFKTR